MRGSIPGITRPRLAALTLALVAASTALAQDRTSRGQEPFRWSGEIETGRWVYVRNLNGDVRVERGTGTKLEITAEKRWRRGDPDDVEITVRQVGSGRGDVLVCAVWLDNRTRCDEDGYSTHSSGWDWRGRRNDTSVQFVVRLPAGVKIEVTTVNGGVGVDGATSTVVVSTVNGGVEARSTGGAVTVRTVNGDVTVRAGALDGERTEYTTVNGSITVELPDSANADVDMRTVNGHVSSDFPLTIQGEFNSRRLRATLGKGGPTLRLSTVNGSIRLRKS